MKAFSFVLLAACLSCALLVSEAKPETPSDQAGLKEAPAQTEPPAERKLVDYTNSSDPSLFLDLVKPDNQQNGALEAESKRLLYLKRMDRWLTKLQSKLDRVKFITKTRLGLLNDNLHKAYKQKGFHPIVKYHRMYNQLMNPIVNPYLQMTINNKLMASPEAQGDPAFQSFQSQLHDYANTYANSIAEFNSGLFYDTPKATSTAVGLGGLSSSQLYASLAARGSELSSSLGPSLGASLGIGLGEDFSGGQAAGTLASFPANDGLLKADSVNNIDVNSGSGFLDISVGGVGGAADIHEELGAGGDMGGMPGGMV